MNEPPANSLLITLGTSWPIVPEAHLLPGSNFTAVHVLTTASEKITPVVDKVRDWFARNAPRVSLVISRVEGFTDLNSEDDHFAFEEVLFRWVLEIVPAGRPHVCLSGGFKTMSAAVQKAAALLGAEEVFHVLCASNPSTAEDIESARRDGAIHFIRLGAESGWPQFRAISATEYPLATRRDDHEGERSVRWVSAPDQRFRQRLREVTERSHRIASSWENLTDLPFQVLATWSRADLEWLEQPLDSTTDAAWVRALPKVELHCHLGGFASHGKQLDEVRAAAEVPLRLPAPDPPGLPAGWPRPVEPVPLDGYMKLGDATGSKLLKDPGCLRRQIELLYQHLRDERVLYAEVRCSPANYADRERDRSPWTVLAEIRGHFQRLMAGVQGEDPSGFCRVNLIVIATRRDGGGFRADIARHLALAVSAAEHWTNPAECRVVGVDLAGFEDRETRAHYFREEFSAVHRCGLALTVHAGENDDAEAVWSAVFDLNARRLGHALHLIDSPELMQSVAARGIGVEMCPYANYQIKGFAPMPADATGRSRPGYPLARYLQHGILATVNTDNIGISAASLNDNLLFVATLCPGFRRRDILQLQANALNTAFLQPAQRRELRRRTETQIPLPLFAPCAP